LGRLGVVELGGFGFLHLYISEEAVAVGAMRALTSGRCRRRDVP
jgi:hypothetical protein